MHSDRIQRQIERFLDEAEAAAAESDWTRVRDRAQNALSLDPENHDATTYLGAAERALASVDSPSQASARRRAAPAGDRSGGSRGRRSARPGEAHPTSVQPASFCDGRYLVKTFLGEGGKKRVFLAHDTKLDRDVAFALIKTDGLNAEGEARIRREAQAMGKLGDHPNIVPVYDIGDEGGQPYLVTQLMGGGDVEGLIEQAPEHRLPLEATLRIADQVCQALEYAHSKGIVHRDLKPGNVWLTGDGTAKLGDFGLAVALDQSRLTQAGMMVGTVSYMPPEQAIGGDVTPRSDLYSLGAMLYEMACGRPPFVGDESVAIITQHLNTPPVSPMWHAPDLPSGLEALILRLLEKDPARRPASAADVRDALARVSSSELRVPSAADPELATRTPELRADPIYGRTFVGREQELRNLQSAFDAALSGQGSLATVVGEPGIGKTSLCEQLATYVAVRGGRALVGHSYEEGSLSLPYLPFVEAMRSYVLTREPDDLRRDLGSGAAEVARLISEIRDRLDVELRPAGDPEDDRWRLLQAVSGFLRNASTVQPLLLVLEDLHDADRGTLDLLLHVSRNLQGARLLIVGTYRDVEVDRSHPLSGALAELRRSGSFLRVPLRGLTVDEVQRMMSIVRGQEVPWSRAELIHRQTEGNPLFVQEVLRYLVEEGIVVREGGRYLLTDAEAGIPEGLRDVIGKRLSQATNGVLSVASVIGREFRLDVLQRVAGLPEDELYRALEEASERAVVEQRQTVGVMGFRFTHAFFRQTLHEEIFVPRRIRLHQQVGKALEEVYGRRLDEHAAELAEHFVQSTEPADLTKALHYSELAAQRAMQVFAYGEAVRHLEQAVRTQEVLDPDDRTKECDLLLALGDALMLAGEPLRAVEEVAPRALTVAEAAQDRPRAAAVTRMALAALHRYGGTSAFLGPEGERWGELADRYAVTGTIERVYADAARFYRSAMGLGGWARDDSLRQTLETARQLGNPQALFIGAYRLIVLGNGPPPVLWEERRRLADELAEMSQEGVDGRTLGGTLWGIGAGYMAQGERERAVGVFGRLDELASRTRDPTVLIRPLQVQAFLAAVEGRLEEAVELALALKARAEDLGSPALGEQLAHAVSRRPLLRLGRYEGAALRNLFAQRAGTSDPFSIALLAHMGSHREAQRGLEDAAALFRVGIDDEGAAAGVLALLLEAALILEDRERAALLAQTLTPLAHLAATQENTTCVARLLGGASALQGDVKSARAYYAQALEVAGSVGNRPEIALTHLQLAESFLAEGAAEQAEALSHLDFAISEFREMKMQPALERALGHKGLLRA